MKIIKLILILLALYSTSAYAEPGMASGWKDTRLSKSKCLDRAEVVLRKFRFTKNFGFTNNINAHGVYKNNLALIRCIPRKKMVFFVVTGANKNERVRLANLLRSNF